MRRPSLASGASALLLLVAVAQAHKGSHDQLEAIHKRHRESRSRRSTETAREVDAKEVAKRGGQCAFPYDAGLVAITPGSANAGWAMSPDQPCLPGNYCPYACPPGQVSQQWDPKATTYSYPMSMHGGLYCDDSGAISKPFPDKPYCKSTVTNIGVVNNASGSVAFCQTVLPGNEAMLIPTAVDGYSTLAVPGTDYWASTAAHYYINPPGTGVGDACVWGSPKNPFGNWSPYVAGTNLDDSGRTYIKLGWNPIYLETTTPFRNVMPNWGVKIDCPNGDCGGLPCQIDPDYNKVNGMKGDVSQGAGSASFCVVSVPKGSTANFVVFGGDSTPSAKGGQFYQSSSAAPSSSSSSSTQVTTSSASTTSSSSTTTSSSTTSSSTTTSSSSTTSSTSSSSSATSTQESSSTTDSMTSSSSDYRTGPSGQPYYSLFNTSVAPSSAQAASTPTATGPGLLAAASTGGATSLTLGAAAIAPLAVFALLV